MQMRLFQKLTPEPHVSFHLQEFSASITQRSLAAILGSLGLPHTEQHKTLKQNKNKGKKRWGEQREESRMGEIGQIRPGFVYPH